MSVFDEMGSYWTEIADQNSTGAQIQFLKNTIKGKGLILDLACGTGRHLIPLSKEGYRIVGLDLSLNLLRIAKNRSSGIQLVRADMRFLPFKAEAFSAAISMDTSLGYLASEQDDIHSLIELKKILSEEGTLIIDVFNRERLMLKYKSNRRRNPKWAFLPIFLKPNRLARWVLLRFFKWKEYPSFFLFQKRTVGLNGDKLHDLWVVRDKAGGKVRIFEHSVRLYEPRQLQTLLIRSGFVVNAVYGDYESKGYSFDSSRLILIASAKL